MFLLSSLILFLSLLFVLTSNGQASRTRAESYGSTGFDHIESFDFRHEGIMSTRSGRNSSHNHFQTFWELESLTQIGGFGPSHSTIRALDISDDQQSILHLGSDGTLLLTRLQSDALPRPYHYPVPVSRAYFTSDSEDIFVISDSYPLSMGILSRETGDSLWQKTLDGAFHQFHYPSSSRLILLRRTQGSSYYVFDRVIVIDTDSGTILTEHDLFIRSTFPFIYFDSSRKHLLFLNSAAEDTIYNTTLVNSDTGKLFHFDSRQSNFWGRFLANSRLLLLENFLNDNSYRIFRTDDGSLFLDLAELGFPNNSRVAVDLDRNRLFVSEDDRIEVWDTNKKSFLFSLPTDGVTALRLAVSDDGETLAAVLNNQSVRVWDLTSESSPRSFPQFIPPVSFRFHFAPSSDRLLYASQSGIAIIDTDLEPQPIRPLARNDIALVGYDQTEGLFYVITDDKSVSFFNSGTLETVDREPYVIPSGNLLAISTEARVALSSRHNSFRISDLDTGKIEWEFPEGAAVSSAFLSQNGERVALRLATGDEIKVYEVASQFAVVSIPVPSEAGTIVSDIKFSPDFASLVFCTLNHDRTPKNILHAFTIDYKDRSYSSNDFELPGNAYGLCPSYDSKWLYFVTKDDDYQLCRLPLEGPGPIQNLNTPFERQISYVYDVSLPNQLILVNTRGEACFVNRDTGDLTHSFDLLQERYALALDSGGLLYDPQHTTLLCWTDSFGTFGSVAAWKLRSDTFVPVSSEFGKESIAISFDALADKTYRLETSSDLLNWNPSEPFTPTAPQSIERAYPRPRPRQSVFIRVFHTTEFARPD